MELMEAFRFAHGNDLRERRAMVDKPGCSIFAIGCRLSKLATPTSWPTLSPRSASAK